LDTTKRRIVTSLAAAAVAALVAASTAAAGDAAAKQASEQVERGYTAARNGYWQEALFRFERANALTPNQPRILNNIAVSLEASGRFEEALATYESALSVAPNDQVLRRNYSRFKEFYEAQLKSTPDAAEEKDDA
jgi:Flp pilus assembly protein TadD